MIYIYDLLLDWCSDDVYEFFEWDETDKLEQIKKIPLLKVDSKTFKDLFYFDVEVSNDFMELIKNKTELFDGRYLTQSCAIFTNGIKTIAIRFNNQGKSVEKSKLVIDEEDDVILLSHKIGITTINYIVNSHNSFDINSTRKEKQIKKELLLIIDNSYKMDNKDELKYMYYECFDKLIEDVDQIYIELKKKINNCLDEKCIGLYSILSSAPLSTNKIL